MQQPAIVDSHCHLDFPQFEEDLQQVIERAGEYGVGQMLTICTKPRLLERSVAIAERFPQVFFAAGVHPHYVASETAVTVEELVQMARHPKMVAIGETGLDYHYTSEIADRQKASLAIHVEAARQTGLPLIIHSRDADDDMADILSGEYRDQPYSCVMHCYSSGRRLAEAALEMGFFLSMSGIITFRNAEELRRIFADVPLDRILIETDAPYLAPAPWRGKRNEPFMVSSVMAEGARLKDVSPAEFAAVTTNNFNRLFGKTVAAVKTTAVGGSMATGTTLADDRSA